MTDDTRGIVLMLLAMAGFAVGDAALKWLGAFMAPSMIVAALGLGGIPIFGAMLVIAGRQVPWQAAIQPVVLGRNLIEICAVTAMVLSLTSLPLSLVIAVTQSVPILALAGAAIFLREPVGPRRWTAVAVGFAGVVLMVAPWGSDGSIALLLPVAASVALAARDVLTRRIPVGIPNAALALWGNIALAIAGSALVLGSGEAPRVPVAAIGVLIVAIAFGAAAYYAVTASLRLAPVPVVVPLRYTRLLFAAVLGYALFGERPGWEVWAGAALVVGSGLYALKREQAVPQAPAAR